MDFDGVFTGKLHFDQRTRLCSFLTIFLILNFGTKFGKYLWRHNVNQNRETVTNKCWISHAIWIILHVSVSYVGEKKPHFWPSWIVLRAVTIYRPETQTNKLKLTLANSSLSDFCHLNVMFICLLSLKWEKWQNSHKNCKLVTLTSSARYAITTPFSWPFSVLLEKCLKFFCLVL